MTTPLHAAHHRQSSGPWLVTMAASAGGVEALRTILRQLPPDFPAAIIIVLDRPADIQSYTRDVLQRVSHLPVIVAGEGEFIRPGVVYVARPDAHLTVSAEERFRYTDGQRIQFVRSSANPLFESVARVVDGRAIAVVLTGTGRDATDGVRAVKAHGGIVIAQDPATAEQSDMPHAAVKSGAVDLVVPLNAIAHTLEDIVRGRTVMV